MTSIEALPPRAGPVEIDARSTWARLLVAVFVVFALFQWSATALGSNYGEAGLAVCALVLAATLLVECVAFGRHPSDAPAAVGLGVPRARGIVAAALAVVPALLVIPAFEATTGVSAVLRSDWVSLTPGLFAQAGVAEETLFRGFLYGHVRNGRSFWRAATLSAVPFVGVHLFLFFTLPWAVALASVMLAVVLSFPFAHLFELGGRTIWPSAVAHFVIQGTIKIVEVPETTRSQLALTWMLASALAAQIVFLIARPPDGPDR